MKKTDREKMIKLFNGLGIKVETDGSCTAICIRTDKGYSEYVDFHFAEDGKYLALHTEEVDWRDY